MQTLIALDAETAQDVGRLGGKACGLVRLLRAGMNVPEAWLLPADVTEIPEAELRELADELGCLLAVRSSATAEDLADASFAGVYDTILGVDGPDALVAAVPRVRATARSSGAIAYRQEKGIGSDVAVAVIVQRMLEPDAAGVLLTTNPRRAFANEIVIDVGYGLGEGVASGRVDPDHVVLDRSDGSVREERIGSKATALAYVRGAGIAEEEVPADDRDRRAVSETQLLELRDLAESIDTRIAPDSDCEWAFVDGELYVLQQRPITNLPPRRPENVWSRRWGDEFLADYVTPHTFGGALHTSGEITFKETWRLAGRTDLDDLAVLRRHKGHLYVNGEFLVRFARAIPPGLRPMAFENWFTPLFMERINAEPFDRVAFLKMLAAPIADRKHALGSLDALAHNNARIEAEVRPKQFQDWSALSDEELRTQMATNAELGDEHFRVIRWAMGYGAGTIHMLLQLLLRAWADDDDGTLYAEILTGLTGTYTARINEEIYQLARLAENHDGVAGRLRAATDYHNARATIDAPEFWRAFDRFIRTHGHRGASREAAEPRWRETPEILLGFVRAQLAGDTGRAPNQIEAEASEHRRSVEAAVLERVGRSRVRLPGGKALRALIDQGLALTVPRRDRSSFEASATHAGSRPVTERVVQGLRAVGDIAETGLVGATRRELISALMRAAQRYTVARENQRYHLDYLITQTRDLVLEHGRRLTSAGVLDDPDEAFLLMPEELGELIGGGERTGELREMITARAAERNVWAKRKPATFLFDDVETEGEIVEGDPIGGDDDDVSGLGAARGVAEGRVRVLTDQYELEHVKAGEILVAPNIDPGWTSVFPLLAGVLTETGGLLSHGALLAREYGIPAVMGVPDARSRFNTGDVLRIDGTTGTIEVVDGSAT